MNPRDCASLRNLLDLHAEGRLEPEQAKAVESHLAACRDCAGLAAAGAALRRAKRAVSLPPNLKERLLAGDRPSVPAGAPPAEAIEGAAAAWQRAAERLCGALALALPLALSTRTFDPLSIKAALFQMGALALAFAWALKGLERGRYSVPRAAGWLLAPAAALAVEGIISLLTSPTPVAALPGTLNGLLMLATFGLALLEIGGYQSLARLSGWLSAAAALAAAHGLLFSAGVDPLGLGATLLGDARSLGLFLALCVPVVLARRLDPERAAAGRRLDEALLAAIAAKILWDGSPAALAAAAAHGAVFGALALALIPGRRARLAGLLAALGGVALLGAGSLTAGFEGRLLQELSARRALPPGGSLIAGAFWLWLALALTVRSWRAARVFRAQGSWGELTYSAGLLAAVLGQAAAWKLSGVPADGLTGWLLALLAGGLGGLSLLARPGTEAAWGMPWSKLSAWAYAPALAAFLGLAALPVAWLESDRQLALGLQLARAGRWDEALSHLDRTVPGAAGYVHARYLAGQAALDAGRPWEALARLQILEDQAGSYERLHLLKARAAVELGQWDRALASLDLALAAEPLDPEAHRLRSRAALEAGDVELARRAALAALRLDQENPRTWETLNAVYRAERLAGGRKRLEQEARKRGRTLKRG